MDTEVISTQEDADAYNFLYRNYKCDAKSPPTMQVVKKRARETGSKIHSRRSQVGSQVGGARLGQYATEWVEMGELMIKEKEEARAAGRERETSTATLRFYRLIIFIETVNLSGLDQQSIHGHGHGSNDNRLKCSNLVDIICLNLTNEAVLTAYLTSQFGSKLSVAFGLTGIGFVAHTLTQEDNAFTYLIQILTYISSNEYVQPVGSFALDTVLTFYGIGGSFTGIMNAGLLLYSIYNMIRSAVTGQYPQPDIIERNIAVKLVPVYKYFLKPLFITPFVQAYGAASRIPSALGSIFRAAKRYISLRAPALVTQDACSAISPTLDKLIGSTEIDPRLLIELGETFNHILTEFAPERAARLKCNFMKQFTTADGGGTRLLLELGILTSPEEATAVAAVARATSACPAVTSRALALASIGRSKSPPYGSGGSSKHKKKHSRPTNKRKLLVKRVRRRSMRNKKKGKW